MQVSMEVYTRNLDLWTNEYVVLTPVLTNGKNRKELAPLEIQGRNRSIVYLRHNRLRKGEDPFAVRYRKRHMDGLRYVAEVPYEEWMRNAVLRMDEWKGGCGDATYESRSHMPLEVNYVGLRASVDAPSVRRRADAAPKGCEECRGSAYLFFHVNSTEIDPHEMTNIRELGKIHATLDSLADCGCQIEQIIIIGNASPEGPYEGNEMLSEGRAEALEAYIRNRYGLDPSIFKVLSVAEDWSSLRQYVELSDLPHKREILDLIDSDRDPDPKEWVLKSQYPDDYKILLERCYPYLRRLDYTIYYRME